MFLTALDCKFLGREPNEVAKLYRFDPPIECWKMPHTTVAIAAIIGSGKNSRNEDVINLFIYLKIKEIHFP